MNRMNMENVASRSEFNLKSSEVSSIHTFTSDWAFIKEISLRKLMASFFL